MQKKRDKNLEIPSSDFDSEHHQSPNTSDTVSVHTLHFTFMNVRVTLFYNPASRYVMKHKAITEKSRYTSTEVLLWLNTLHCVTFKSEKGILF